MAIFTLFLTTGIRISELCSLDISDVDIKARSFKVLRKGGNEAILYFGEETARALDDYIEERKAKVTYSQNSPMFLSLQNKRISVRAMQMLVQKYASIAVPLKDISPHKLRSTYGTLLYQNTGDIYLVADVLGHKDVNTTRKYYAAIDESQRKRAAKAVVLRDKDE
ncbi:MAG: tyrosine-type recombinase/integrase [Christensenellales bacterium]